MSKENERVPADEVESRSQNGTGEDPESMSLEDLSSLINSEREVEDAPEVEEDQSEGVEAADEADEPQAEEQPGEPTDESQAEIDPLEEIRTRLEIAEAEAKRFEQLLGRKTGYEGHLKNKVRELEAENQKLRQKLDSGYSEDVSEDDPPARRSTAKDSVVAWAVQQAVNSAGQQFGAAHQGEPEILSEVQRRLQESGQDVSHILESDDPVYAMQEATNLLERVYLEAKRDHLVKQRDEQEKRRVDQAERLKKKKRAASVSTSGGTDSAPKPKPDFDPSKASLDELRKLIEANRPEAMTG